MYLTITIAEFSALDKYYCRFDTSVFASSGVDFSVLFMGFPVTKDVFTQPALRADSEIATATLYPNNIDSKRVHYDY